MNSNPLVGGGLAAGLLVLVLALLWMRAQGPGPEAVFFYDLNSKTLVAEWSDALSPSGAGGGTWDYGEEGQGGSAVQANIWGCEDRKVELKVGMTTQDIAAAGAVMVSVERYPLDVVPVLKRMAAGEEVSERESVQFGNPPKLVSDPNDINWTRATGRAAVKLMEPADTLCSDVSKLYFVTQ